jgi:hypothetical protein
MGKASSTLEGTREEEEKLEGRKERKFLMLEKDYNL